MENYIQNIRKILSKKIVVDDDLLSLYSLLVLIKKGNASLEDIHDAWSIWKNEFMPSHKSIVPFNKLTTEIQEKNREYTEAINETWLDLSTTPLNENK